MLALSGAAMATEVTELLQITDNSTTATFSNSFDLSKDWELRMADLSICPFYQGEKYVDFLSFTTSSGQTLTLSSLNPHSMSGASITLGSTSDTAYICPDLMPGAVGHLQTTWCFGAGAGFTMDMRVKYSAADGKITVTTVASNGETIFDETDLSISANFAEGTLLTGISSPIPTDLLAEGSYWSLPTVAFTGTSLGSTSAVPEPTTATLSLLALAGLAARRRRK